MKHIFLFCSLLFVTATFAQVRIDSSFSFQTAPSKDYSLYIPSTYDAASPNKMMVGFHPRNTARWWAESWCDTLINFAETNGLILMCPDGGTDGGVDDPIDTAFTSALMDSMNVWYNIDGDKVYAMGFSVGGRATYTYGLNHINEFGGFIPIGAFVNGTTEVNGIIQNSQGIPYYLVHGQNDSPGTRFTPMLDALNGFGAITNSILMPGVGHTIDFPNRNQILTDAFVWIDSVNCNAPVDTNDTATFIIDSYTSSEGLIAAYPSLLKSGTPLTIEFQAGSNLSIGLVVLDAAGRTHHQEKVQAVQGTNQFRISDLSLTAGIYFIRLEYNGKVESSRIVVQ